MNRRLCIGGVYAIVFATAFVALLPLRHVNPIADDLHLLAQGSGMMRTRGFLWVIGQWADFDLSSAHWTPLGGIWTAVYVWVVNQLALRTPMDISTAWGVGRIAWPALAIVSVFHFVRVAVPRLAVPWTTPWLSLLVLLATVQVHAYWSNDPVISFPVASWAFCVIGFLYLASLLKLGSGSKHSMSQVIVPVLLSLLGILTYELFLSFLIAGLLMLVGLKFSHRIEPRVVARPLILAVGVPLSILVIGQFVRMSQESTYSGTEIALGSGSLPKIALVALLGSLPLTNLPKTSELLPGVDVVANYALLTMSVLVGIAYGIMSKYRNRDEGDFRFSSLLSVIVGLVSLWLTSTAVIVATPKYQSELAGEIGKVYVNYAPGWLAIGVCISLLAAWLMTRKARWLGPVFIGAILLIGAVQSSTNSRQLSILARDSSWSDRLLSLLESPLRDGSARCEQVDLLFALPFPEYYQLEILDGMHLAYSGTYGVPYCDFDSTERGNSGVTRTLGGTFPIEFLPDGRDIFWMSAPSAQLQIYHRGKDKFSGKVTLNLSLPACGEKSVMDISLGDDHKTVQINPGQSQSLSFQVHAEPMQSFLLELKSNTTGCTTSSDPRLLVAMVENPRFVTSEM
jgi:hypothetical protein